MLSATLRDDGETELAKKVEYLRTAQSDNILSVNECFAIRNITPITPDQKLVQETI